MADLKLQTDPQFRKQGLPDSIKMSNLQNLLQDALLSTSHVEKAALVNCQDHKVVAATVGFKIDGEKAALFVDAFKSSPVTRQRGLLLDGLQYECVRADSMSVYAKNELNGLILVHTKSLVLVSTYKENMYPSVAVEATEKLADYFRAKGK